MDNILKEGFIREIKYPEWLANVVVVPKKGGKWRVCVDYTDLNEACLKYSFPLPWIYQIVEALAGHGMLSFLDAFSRYHQIPMHSPDVKKIAFITPHVLFCYNVMPFGLKNAGPTYQRLVTNMFSVATLEPRPYPTRLEDPDWGRSVESINQIHLINASIFILKSLRKRFQFGANP